MRRCRLQAKSGVPATLRGTGCLQGRRSDVISLLPASSRCSFLQPHLELDDFASANVHDPTSGTVIQLLRKDFAKMALFQQQHALMVFKARKEFIYLHSALLSRSTINNSGRFSIKQGLAGRQ